MGAVKYSYGAKSRGSALEWDIYLRWAGAKAKHKRRAAASVKSRPCPRKRHSR